MEFDSTSITVVPLQADIKTFAGPIDVILRMSALHSNIGGVR